MLLTLLGVVAMRCLVELKNGWFVPCFFVFGFCGWGKKRVNFDKIALDSELIGI
jgi:hypothetical protein